MSAVVNPYAPPKAEVADMTQATTQAEVVRQEHIKHESSIRSTGMLYYLSGFMMLVLAVILLAGGIAGSRTMPSTIVGVVYVALGALSVATARGLHALRP